LDTQASFVLGTSDRVSTVATDIESIIGKFDSIVAEGVGRVGDATSDSAPLIFQTIFGISSLLELSAEGKIAEVDFPLDLLEIAASEAKLDCFTLLPKPTSKRDLLPKLTLSHK
jgi:hypothetical protein